MQHENKQNGPSTHGQDTSALIADSRSNETLIVNIPILRGWMKWKGVVTEYSFVIFFFQSTQETSLLQLEVWLYWWTNVENLELEICLRLRITPAKRVRALTLLYKKWLNYYVQMIAHLMVNVSTVPVFAIKTTRLRIARYLSTKYPQLPGNLVQNTSFPLTKNKWMGYFYIVRVSESSSDSELRIENLLLSVRDRLPFIEISKGGIFFRSV